MRSATTDAKTPFNYAHMNNRFSPTQAPCNIHAAITPAPPAAHRRYLSWPSAATLHGKTQGFVLRLPPPTQAQCNIHAAITKRFATKASKAPCNCEAQKHAKHIEPALTLPTTPSPAPATHTHCGHTHTHTLAQKYLIELLLWSASGVHKQSPKV